jgi:hypothetical protein
MDKEEAEELWRQKELMIDLEFRRCIEKAQEFAEVHLPKLSDDGLVQLAILFARLAIPLLWTKDCLRSRTP